MSAEYTQKRASLCEQVEKSEDLLKELACELEAVDGELDAFTQKNRQYDVLSQVCNSLEELDRLGATQLFWDEQNGPDNSDKLLSNARRNLKDFSEQVARIEDHRCTIVERIGEQQNVLDDLHYDLQNIAAQEERRRNNWIIEREPDALPNRIQVMPWARGLEEDRRFRQSLVVSLLTSFALAVLIGSIAIPVVERAKITEVPERVAKLVRERTPPPPPETVEEPDITEKELPTPEPEPVQERPPEPTSEPVLAQTEKPIDRPPVKPKGILAFRDSLARRAELRPTAQLGARARLSTAGATAVGRTERSMVSTSAPGSSGGINLADISRDVGGGGPTVDGVELTRVASTIGGGSQPDRPQSNGSGASAGRTDEEIQIVFDRYKAALYRLYNRELRKDPTLRGQLVLRLTIEPDGRVSLCQLQSSNMRAPALAQQVVDRILTFDFGAKQNIAAMTIIYPIDFLPAS